MTRSLHGAVVLIIVAVGLFLGLTRFGQEVDTFTRDRTFTRSSPGRLIFPPLGGRVISPRCADVSPCKVRLVTVYNELYARSSIPPAVAQIGGIVVPLLLLSIAGSLPLSKMRGPWHVVSVLPLLLGGLILLLPLVGIVYLDTHHQKYLPKGSLWNNLISPGLPSTIVASGILLGGVVWISIDAFRGRHSNQ